MKYSSSDVNSETQIKFGFRWVMLIMLVGLMGCTDKDNLQPFDDPVADNDSSLVTAIDSLVYFIDRKPTAYNEADRLCIWYPASDFEPVGIYLPSGKAIEINVKNLEGSSQPKLLVGTYSRIKWNDRPTVYILNEGDNTITDPHGGLIYLKYVSNNANPSGSVEVTFKGGERVPFYKLGETTHEEWLEMLDSMTYEDVHLISNRTMLTVSKETAIQFKGFNQDETLIKLDSVSDIEDYISGIDGSSDLHMPNVHKILITETSDPGVFLAAAEHRIMVETDACNRFMDPNKISNDSWGIWHEMGHHRQALNWDWNEVDEVTVNIYSLAVLYAFDGDMRWLRGHTIWDVLADYYFQLPLEDRNYNTDNTITGKGRLAMFRQLWMAYGDEFYINVHKLAREENAKPDPRVLPRYQSTGDEQMAHFMLLASEASGYNLKNFFIQWGFILPQEDFDALDALGFPEPSIDLLSLRE